MKKEEKRGEYVARMIICYVSLALGIFLVGYDVLNSPIGALIVFGFELIGASYYIAKKEFTGFKN